MKNYLKRALCCFLAVTVASISCFIGFNSFIKASATPTNAVFDFSDAGHLEYAVAKYGNGSATVASGALNLSLKNNHCMKVRFPFELENGKTYKVKYDLTLSENKALLLGIAYSSSTNSYDGMFNEGNRFTISNGNRTTGNHTVEYSFVADITDENYNKLGLIFWATAADATVIVDNLEISVVETDKNNFDFSTSSDLEYAVAKYGNGSASVADGKLNLSLKSNHCMKVRIPFEFKNGKTYKVKYDMTLSENKSLLLGIAYSSSTNSYDGMFNEGNRFTISNGNRTSGTHTVEYAFVADITDESYNKLGLIFWATSADATVTVDNLEISVVETDKNNFDFSTSTDLEYAVAKYGNGSATVGDGVLNLSLQNNRCMKVRIPFVLENGKTYKVKYDLTLTESKALLLGIAYSSSTNSYDGMFNESNRFTISNGNRTAGTHTIEYTFVADITDESYNKLGLVFWATSADATVTVDNLEISVVEAEKNKFDFSMSTDLDYGIAKYGNGSATVGDGVLNLSLQNNRCMKLRFPFTLQNGKTYKVKYDLTLTESKALLLGIAYSSSANSYDGMFNESNRFTISNGNRTVGTHTVEYTFVADITDESYNKLGLIFWATAADAIVTVDNLEIEEIETGNEPDEPDNPDQPEKLDVKFDFSEENHISAMYAPDGVSLEEGAIKINIATAYNYVKLKFPAELQKGKTYIVKYKVKAAQDTYAITLIGAYAHKTNKGYDILKNSPTSDTKQVFNLQNVERFLKDEWKTVNYEFTADYADDYNYFGLFLQSGVVGTYYIDDLEIAEKEEGDKPDGPEVPDEPEKVDVKFDFSDESHISSMYAPDGIAIENEAIKIDIKTAYNYAKIRFPVKLQKGKTYFVQYKVGAAQNTSSVTMLGAYAHETNVGYDILKNWPISDTKQVFNSTNVTNIKVDNWKTVSYYFDADYADGYNHFGLFLQTSVLGTYYIDDLEIVEKEREPEEPEVIEKVDVKFDFSDESHVSEMYAPDGIAIEDGAIKIDIKTAYNYAKIRFPVKLQNGKTYTVMYKVKAAQDTSTLTLLGAYAHETKSGYDILKNWPTSDTKQVFNVKNVMLAKDTWTTIKYEFTADYADGYNHFGLFLQTSILGAYYIDDLEIAEKDNTDESEEVQEFHKIFDFSDESHVSAMYAPDGVSIEDEAIKINIAKANNYAKIRIPLELKKGETYHVRLKVKAVQGASVLTVLGAYAHETNLGYNILKNWPMDDTKQVFNVQTLQSLRKDKWKTVTYSFTADYADGYNYFGLFLQTSVLGTYFIDDLEITNKKVSPFEPEKELIIKDYDFSNEEQLSFGSSAEIENGELKFTFDREWAAGKTRFPFILENGKAYEFTFKARSDIMDKTIHIWPAYALAVDSWDVIKNTDKNYVVSQTYRRFYNSDWVECKYTFIANSPEERYKYLGLFMQSTAAGYVWVDDMHIREVRLVDLRANYQGTEIDMNQLVADATGDIELPKTINKQFAVDSWYLDEALTQSTGFTLKTDNVSTTIYAKVKYNDKFTIDFEGENPDISISCSNSTTKKMITEGNNTYLSFSIAKAYDNLLMKTNYLWFANRSYRLTMRYKFSGTAWLEMGLLKADFTGNSGPGFTQTVVYPMRDTYGVCDWKELVIEFDTQDMTFDDAFKYIKMLVWFKEGTDAFLSIDDITLEDLGVYKESDFKPHIDEYTWDEFKEEDSLYSDWKNWQILKVKADGTYAPSDNESNSKWNLKVIIPVAAGVVVIAAGAIVAGIFFRKRKLKVK